MEVFLANIHAGLTGKQILSPPRGSLTHQCTICPLFLCQETAVFHITAVLSVSDPRVTMAIAQASALADPGGTHGVTEATLNH